MVPENGFQNHLQGRVREAYPPSMQRWSVVKQPDNRKYSGNSHATRYQRPSHGTPLLRRFLTPWHGPMDIPFDSWFRTVVLPIAAMEDGHLVATISAVTLAVATGKLDLCIQGLFGAGKSRTAAILLSGLLALDKEGLCHFQVICKENTGTRSFANMLLYLEVPTDLRLLIGRFVADSEANKSGSGTYFDIFHSSNRTRVQQSRLLLMTGGSCAGDRASPFSTLETWLASRAFFTVGKHFDYPG